MHVGCVLCQLRVLVVVVVDAAVVVCSWDDGNGQNGMACDQLTLTLTCVSRCRVSSLALAHSNRARERCEIKQSKSTVAGLLCT